MNEPYSPRGDGNDNSHLTPPFLFMNEPYSPRGDGNFNLIHIVPPQFLHMNEPYSPRGDGNIFRGLITPLAPINERTLFPERGRKLIPLEFIQLELIMNEPYSPRGDGNFLLLLSVITASI